MLDNVKREAERQEKLLEEEKKTKAAPVHAPSNDNPDTSAATK